MIHISLTPNTEIDDVFLALKWVLMPWRWLRGEEEEKLRRDLADYLGVEKESVFLTNSGRSAEYLLLKALGVGNGDRVFLQAFTCNAVVNPILWLGAKPVFVDIDEGTYNMDAKDLERKILSSKASSSKATPGNLKAVIVQHTFGLAADLGKIMAVARKYDLIVIEDCAHSLGGRYKSQMLGTIGDAGFFSFGRDKVISSVYGGAIIKSKIPAKSFAFRRAGKNQKSKIQIKNEKLEENYKTWRYPSRRWVWQQLWHPLIANLALLTYDLGLGKVLMVVCQKLGILSMAVSSGEKVGKKPGYFPAKMPNALCALARHQLAKIEQINEKRRLVAERYNQDFRVGLASMPTILRKDDEKDSSRIWLRYPLRVKNPRKVWQEAKKKGVILGDWYWSVVAPEDTDLKKMGYKKGSCPVAERVAKTIINLPTARCDAKKVEKVMRVLREILSF